MGAREAVTSSQKWIPTTLGRGEAGPYRGAVHYWTKVRMDPDTIPVDEAVIRFQREEISLAKAAELTGMTRIDFQRELTRRSVPVHYTSADLAQETPIDIANPRSHP